MKTTTKTTKQELAEYAEWAAGIFGVSLRRWKSRATDQGLLNQRRVALAAAREIFDDVPAGWIAEAFGKTRGSKVVEVALDVVSGSGGMAMAKHKLERLWRMRVQKA